MPKKVRRAPRRDLHKIDAEVDMLAVLSAETVKETKERLKLKAAAQVIEDPTMDEFFSVLVKNATS